MTMTAYNVGKVVKVIWEEDTDSVQIVMEITDPDFKNKVIHSKDFQDILTFNGKDVMLIASRKK